LFSSGYKPEPARKPATKTPLIPLSERGNETRNCGFLSGFENYLLENSL
jgi:hypothetical protein